MTHSTDAAKAGEQAPDAKALFPDMDAALMEAMLSDWGEVQPNQLAISHPMLVREIRSCDPLKAATTFAGLLTRPEIQANCVRLEALVHLSLAYGQGRRKPNRHMVATWFATIGNGKCGQLEDPAEDVHISLVTTSRGNFRIFEGIWEGAGFNLQRILGVLEAMPAGPPFDDLRSSVFALLAISDATAARANLDRYVLGEEFPHGDLPPNLLTQLANLRRTVRFSRSELETIGASRRSLAIFMLGNAAQSALADQPIGHTSLERCPLLADGDGICLVLPTAVSAAVRRAIIEWCIEHGLGKSFERALSKEYSAFLGDLPLLGGKAGVPAHFRSIGDISVSSAFQRIDVGRYINWIFFIDGLAGYENGGLRGANPSPEEVGKTISTIVADSQAAAERQPDFRSGLTLIVGCGWGRGLRLQPPPDVAKWRWQVLDAKDLETLSYAPRFQPLSLWRALDGVEIVEQAGIRLNWANGLLNLVAWQRSLDEHLVPHASLPVDFVEEGRTAFLLIPQNSLRDLRHEVNQHNDVRSLLDGHGQWVAVRKIDSGYFKEDRIWPLYASTAELRRGRLRAVFASIDRAWWVELTLPTDAKDGMYFEYWQMLGTWLCRAVPVIESVLHTLPRRPITWLVSFEAVPDQLREKPKPLLPEALPELLHIETSAERATVSLSVKADFVSTFHNPENIAERTLVDALLRGTCKLASQPISDVDQQQLLARIVPNDGARHIHLMQARSFRDFTRPSLPKSPLLISRQDSALSEAISNRLSNAPIALAG